MRAMKDSGVECIGKIPYGKNVLRNKYLLEYVKGKLPQSTNLNKDGLPYIGATYLDTDKDEDIYTNDINLPDATKEDLLVLWDGARAGLVGRNKEGKISSTIVRIRGNKNTIYQPFLYWYYKGFEEYMYQCVGGTTIPHMNRKYIEDIGFIDWTISEQIKLTSYLDTKCSKIDAIIEKQQAVIEKLKEYKLSIITEAVTKGLNPDVEMKYSGVDWIGEVPKHWDVSTMKRYCRVNQGLQIAQDDRFFESGENRYVYITVKYLNSNKKDVAEYIHNPPINTICNKDDLLMARTGATGNLVTNIEGCFHNNFFKINYNKAFFVKDFLVYYFLQDTIKSYLHLLAGTTTIPDLNHDDFYTTPILLPPLLEQETIVKFLNVKCNFIEDVIKKKKKVIKKFTEYKKSLIYEIVTGKKEV